MSVNERAQALHILTEIRSGNYHALEAQLNAHAEWSAENKALISNLVYTVLSQQIRIDAMIDLYSAKPHTKLHPLVCESLRLAVAQFLWMDRIPKEAVVNEAVNLVKNTPFTGFTNAVLRQMLRENLRESWPERQSDLAGHLSVRYSFPIWMVQLWQTSYGNERAECLCRAMSKPRGISLRVNLTRSTVEEVRKLLPEAKPGFFVPEALRLGKGLPPMSDKYQIQDESSMLVAYAVAPKPSWHVLDLCAAPGGKATHLAEKMDGEGLVEARDLAEAKLDRIRQNADRLGLRNVRVRAGDARVLDAGDEKAWDAVLLDAPCSGLGVLRNKPDLKLADPSRVQTLPALQAELLDRAAARVKDGGVLVYSTCTLNPSENEEQIQSFLERHPEFETEDLGPYLPMAYPRENLERGTTTVWPAEEGLDGFFLCRMRRK